MVKEKIKKETKQEVQEIEAPERNYEIAEISKFEFLLCLVFWFYVVLSGCYTIYRLSYNKKTVEHFLKEGFIKRTYFGLYMNINEMMWLDLTAFISKGWPYFTIYLLFSIILRSKASPTIFMFGCLSLSIFMNYYNSSLKFLGMQVAIFVVAALAGFTRSKTLVWIIGLTTLYYYRVITEYPFFNDEYIFVFGFQYMGLLVTRGISVGVSIANSPKFNFQLVLEMAFYFWYFPAIVGCRMMVTRDFVAQIYKPYVLDNWRLWITASIRLVIYFLLWTVIINVVQVRLIYHTHDIKYINLTAIIASQIFTGIHYYMYYLILYKGGYLISQTDGFLTADGPECIVHIALYSRMWKNFDTGMHNWLKDVAFRPIVRLGPWYITKYVAALACFGFVVLFHGLEQHHIVWISLNIFQYFMQIFLIFLFLRTWFGQFMEENFSAISIRRMIGVIVGISFLMSTYGFGCYYLGTRLPNTMYKTLINENYIVMFGKWIYVLLFAYSHAQISLTTCEYLRKRKLKTC